MASEEVSFENVDDGQLRTKDACLYYKLTYEPKRWAKNVTFQVLNFILVS